MRKFLLCALILGLFIIPAKNKIFSADFEGKFIKKVYFTGLIKAEEKKLKSTLSLTEGIKFEAESSSKDFKNLYSLGYFEDIQLDIKEEEGKLVLNYIVTERPWIVEIKFKGNNEVSDSTIRKLLSNKEEAFYDPYVLELDKEKILKEYVKEGYVGTEVSFNIERTEKPEKPTEVDLIVEIKEGEQIYIEKIEIKGTVNMDPDDLKKKMDTVSEPKYLGIKTFGFDLFEYEATEKAKMIQYGKDNGYINFKVKDTKVEKKTVGEIKPTKIEVKENDYFNFGGVEISGKQILKMYQEKAERKAYFISIDVEEGDQYTFNGIEIFGNKKIATKELMSALDLKPGELYNDSKFMDFMRNAYMEYQSAGFFYSKITPKENRDEQNKTISYKIDFYEGDKVHIENMYIVGNTKTATYVIDRELRLREGEIYDFSKLLKSRERLMKTQFFQSAMFDPKTGSEEGLIDLFWKIEEGKTGLLTLGGGWGTLSGWTAFMQVSELNLFGKGLNLSLRGDYGQKRQAISTSLGGRYIGYMPISWSFSVSYSWQENNQVPLYDRGKVDTDPLSPTYGQIISSKKDGIAEIYYPGDGKYHNYYQNGHYYNLPYGAYEGDTRGDRSKTYISDSDEYYFKTQTVGLGVGLGYNMTDEWHTGVSQNVTFSKYYHPYNITVANIVDDPKYKLGTFLSSDKYWASTRTGFSITYDTTDNYLTPTKGFLFAPSASFYGLMGGYNKFTDGTLDLSNYLTLLKHKRLKWNLVWANHIAISTLTTLPGKDEIELSTDYQLSFDGMRDLKGWGDYVGYDNYRGFSKVSLGSELRIPIPGTENLLWGALFFDGGKTWKETAFQNSRQMTALSEYLYSYGFGLKIEIPMFPIRFYFAKRLLWQNGWFREQDDKWQFVLSISGFF